ncbi:hypothetical protein M404DRAFT_1008481 [Pisolithus tinctorius Marx 270]|uniref:Uncharacterized protein n=1 Tax=Pisolithus tinctorius Marx 270 TaxID=870435 RepID=A0A0C3IB37_PISTI|nr:hypothetical protein M404DRAFT_1008481 [Pisolithus tinctorius Marx 270]
MDVGEEKLEVVKGISELNARLRWGGGGERSVLDVGSEPIQQENAACCIASFWARLLSAVSPHLARGHYTYTCLPPSDQTPVAPSWILPHRSSVMPPR